MEQLCHKENAFITLTYSDEHLPKGGSLAPEETRKFLYRLRFNVRPHRIRFYLVGEYGDKTWRPHYHAILFGYPQCKYGMSRYSKERTSCCEPCDLIRDTWGLGNVYVGSVGIKSAQYVAGYVTKKMTRFDDPRLQKRMRETGQSLHPEFSRKSLKPGIGHSYLHEIASTLMEFDVLETQGDVPSSLRVGSRLMPLGRYLRQQLREMCGVSKKAPQVTLDAMEDEVFEMLRAQGIDPLDPNLKGELRKTVIKNTLVDAGHQRRLSQKARYDIFKSRKPLDG